MSVRTRFAPSPTGYLHIGGARTALFSWLYARHHGGQFVLRIEDTDRERSTEESVQVILDAMTWLGLDYDEGPYYQTQRMARYQEVIQQLLDSGQAYYCYSSKEELEALREEQMARKEKPRYDGRYRDFTGEPPAGVEPVIRFKNPLNGVVEINDLIKGKVVVANQELDDLIIARSDGSPTYNLTVVVDDMDMGITHVIRGDDHLNNTPRQINILTALGAQPPLYAHVPMILGEDGKRYSKRHGAANVMQYKEQGYLPEALINYLVRLGWSHGDQEIFSIDELVKLFSLEAVNKAPSTFNPSKLLWLNEQYIKQADAARLGELLAEQLQSRGIDISNGPEINLVADALRERAKTMVEMADAAVYFYADPESYDEKAAKKHLKQDASIMLEGFALRLRAISQWDAGSLHESVAEHAEAMSLKMGKVGMPLRVALTGGTSSPDIGVTLQLIGKERAIQRVEAAAQWIKNNSPAD
ncbi:MAG: glutamate--tRNA ligase [Thiotrichales bacterium]